MLKKIKDDLELWNNYYLENKKIVQLVWFIKECYFLEIHNLVGNNGKERLNAIADSIFNNEMFYKKIFKHKENYFIIQKANDSIFGQLTLSEFETLKRNKKINLEFE